MQSIFRAMRRGNAVAYMVSEVSGLQVKYKKGSSKSSWRFAKRHSITGTFLDTYAPCI